MTRINCVPVTELESKFLLAEYRELPRISALAKAVKNASREYKLGTGHVTFFYDKGTYLKRIFENEIVPELLRRGFKLSYLVYRDHPEGLNRDWTPTKEAMEINRERLNERRSKKETV